MNKSNQRRGLPFDVARCNGADDAPCDHCARQHFRKTGNPYGQAFIEPRANAGHCPNFIDMVYDDR